MSKMLKTAAIVVGAVALVATGIGAAAGLGAFGSLAAGTMSAATAATLGTIATVATIAGATAGILSLAAGLTAKKPTATSSGSQTSFSADPDAGIPYVAGRTGTAGNIVLRKGFDTGDAGDNDRQSFVSILSLGPVKSVGGFTSDQSPVSFSSAGTAIGALAGFMWMTTQLGAMPEPSALSFGSGAGTPPGWTAAHKLSGKAAATWTLRFDTKAKLYQGGVPAPMWIVEGGLCYDPRKDSTYPGGSGPHRMADPSDRAAYDAAVATWEYSECPYLHALKWAHGIWQRDMTDPASKWQRVMGMGAPLAGIDLAAFVEGANIADANGWKVGGVIYSGDPKWDSFKKILQSGMGEPMALGARISCLVNAPRVSLATITVDDVIGRASVSATQPRRDRINTVTPRYRLEANNWRLLPGPPISVAEHIAEDGGKRSKVLDYPYIQDSKQVATAVRYDIENAREFGPIVLPLKLAWMGYKPGDCVTVQLPEVGLNDQPILLLNRQLEPDAGVVTMTARSETEAKHSFALGQTTAAPTTPGVSGPPVVPVPREEAWEIVSTGLSAGNAVSPALIIEGAVDAATAEAIIVEYRPFVSGQAGGENWRAAGIFQPDTERVEIASVAPGTAYEVAISYRVRGIIGDRRMLGPESTSPAVATYPDGTSINDLKPAEGGATKGAIIGQGPDRPGTIFDLDGNPVPRVDIVTSEGTALDTANVAGRPSLAVIDQQSRQTVAQVLAVVAQEEARLKDLAKQYPGDDGAHLSTLIYRAQVAIGQVRATADLLLEAFTDGEEGFARFLLRGEVDEGDDSATIVGIEGIAGTGGLSVLKFMANLVQFLNPTTLAPMIYFDVPRGLIVADSVEVNTLKNNTAAVRGFTSATSLVSGPGTGGGTAWSTLLSLSIDLPAPGDVEATAAFAMNHDGTHEWEVQILIDGDVTFFTGSPSIQEKSVVLLGAKYCDAGVRTVQLQWKGHADIDAANRSLSVTGFPFTE